MIDTGRLRGAFTLVELLVVVAIIALLISILLPSLASAREQARATKCISNLRAQGGGMYIYSNEAEGLLLPINQNYTLFPDNEESADSPMLPKFVAGMRIGWGGKAGLSSYGVDSEDPFGFASTGAGFGPNSRPLNKVLYKSNQGYSVSPNDPDFDEVAARRDESLDLPIFRCPSDQGWIQSLDGENIAPAKYSDPTEPFWGTSLYDLYGNSYYSATPLFTVSGGAQSGSLWSLGIGLLGSDRVVKPSRLMVSFEGRGRNTEMWNHFMNPLGGSSGFSIDDYDHFYAIGNHGGFNRVSSLFVDGHVAFIQRRVRTNFSGFKVSGERKEAGYEWRGSDLQEYYTQTNYYYPKIGSFLSWTQLPKLAYEGTDWTIHNLPAQASNAAGISVN